MSRLTSSLFLVYPCVTPDAERAYCTSLFSCPHLMKALGSTDPLAVEFVRQSICLGCEAGDFMVCCGPPPSQKESPIPSPPTTATAISDKYSSDTSTNEDLLLRYKEAVKQRLLPDQRYCGYQHKDDRPYDSPITALDEFPWLVHVRFSNSEYEEQYADRCSGVLINNRYVLTDAYCGAESIKVKIGEYNTNQSVSCDPASKLEDCNEPVYDIAVEEIIRDGKKSNGPYDFSLLRLVKPVEYSDFVRPICLPIDQSKRPSPTSLVFSGWGAPNSTGIAKKRLTYNVVNDEVCYKESDWLEGNVKFANASFICTSPPINPTTLACAGEHGGPFMYSLTRRIQWYVEGIIVSVMHKEGSSNSCNDKYPVNGIRITDNTIDWILSTIRR
ncbi:hypothetical protein PPYR_07770 [Photinus pyralis]|uniref:CLIP domain-containing serine protease n=1 Tax=Photinus pyralis TaxID=7054 RepID=A0A1Y1KGF8_PHOPY|nr:hypothetical protein PPYR_07770 [Photinus pyralis]